MKKMIAVLCMLLSSLWGFARAQSLPETILFGKEKFTFEKTKNNTAYYYSPSENLLSITEEKNFSSKSAEELKKRLGKGSSPCPGQNESFAKVSVVKGSKGEFLESQRTTRFSFFSSFIENPDPGVDYLSEICALNDVFTPHEQQKVQSNKTIGAFASAKDISAKPVATKDFAKAKEVPSAIFFANE